MFSAVQVLNTRQLEGQPTTISVMDLTSDVRAVLSSMKVRFNGETSHLTRSRVSIIYGTIYVRVHLSQFGKRLDSLKGQHNITQILPPQMDI